MYNFPLHLICVLTLPVNTLTSEFACCLHGRLSSVSLFKFVLAAYEDFAHIHSYLVMFYNFFAV